MKKFLLIITFVVLITGCNDKSMQLRKAKDAAACHNNGGVHINSNFMFMATCKDGTKFMSDNYTGELVSRYLLEIQNEEAK